MTDEQKRAADMKESGINQQKEADKKTDKPSKTAEELDKEVQEKNQKAAEERKKLVDETVGKLQKDVGEGQDLQSGQEVVREIADRVSKTQVVAAGAEYGPTPMMVEELKKGVFPFVAPPLPDGTPVANIAQAEPRDEAGTLKKEDKPQATPVKK